MLNPDEELAGHGALPTPGCLSQRAQRALKPAFSYLQAFQDAKARVWSPEDPEGNIIMSLAENKLSDELVLERLARAKPCPMDALHYQNFRGLLPLRQAIAGLLERTSMQGIRVHPDHLCCVAGCSAALDSLFHCICNPGDAVLIPAPYYPAFDNDLQVKAGVCPTPFMLVEAGDGEPAGELAPSVEAQLEAAAEAVRASGRRVGALLFTNPNNPTGTVYRRDTLVAMLRWCLRNQLHIVCDELYALSVWGEGAAGSFESLEVVAREEAAAGALPDAGEVALRVHTLWGASKDLCASGLRCGVLHTRNPFLVKAMENFGFFIGVSCQTQFTLLELLQDRQWIDGYLEENKARLRRAYGVLAGALSHHGIAAVPACSGMFAWLDLRHLLREPSWLAEEELCLGLARTKGVLLTPGQACHSPQPGFFRMCWSWVPTEALPVAVERIAEYATEVARATESSAPAAAATAAGCSKLPATAGGMLVPAVAGCGCAGCCAAPATCTA